MFWRSGIFMDGGRYGMTAMAFQSIHQVQYFLLIKCRVKSHFLHLEYALGHRAGLVHHDVLYRGQGVQKITSFDQYPVFACSADSAKISQWNTNDQGARAGNYQKYQRPI